jgi:hypothetical protein
LKFTIIGLSDFFQLNVFFILECNFAILESEFTIIAATIAILKFDFVGFQKLPLAIQFFVIVGCICDSFPNNYYFQLALIHKISFLNQHFNFSNQYLNFSNPYFKHLVFVFQFHRFKIYFYVALIHFPFDLIYFYHH